MKNIPYKILMSGRADIQIDNDEMATVIRSVKGGFPAMLRTAFFNPSFFTAVVKDTDRIKEFKERVSFKINDAELLEKGIPKLRNIFDDDIIKLAMENDDEDAFAQLSQ